MRKIFDGSVVCDFNGILAPEEIEAARMAREDALKEASTDPLELRAVRILKSIGIPSRYALSAVRAALAFPCRSLGDTPQ